MKEPTIHFRNAMQAEIYDKVLRGDLSDGIWENETSDKKLWDAKATVAVTPDEVGCNFTPMFPVDFDNEILWDGDTDSKLWTIARSYLHPINEVEELRAVLQDMTSIVFYAHQRKNKSTLKFTKKNAKDMYDLLCKLIEERGKSANDLRFVSYEADILLTSIDGKKR